MCQHLILDTDIDTDCDDTGALAVLHALMDAGECELLGVVCSLPLRACAGAARAVNAWYGRGGVPVGLVQVTDYPTAVRWKPYRDHRARCVEVSGAELYPDRLSAARPRNDPPPEDAVQLYRRLLAGQPDRSVTICAIGTLTALAQLLASGPDDQSPLGGAELVARKVRELVTMASAKFPAGRERYNWGMDPTSTATVLNDWPTPVTVSATGETVLTGARFTTVAPVDHPVRVAYETYLEGPGRNRPSWDPIAALYAVRGLGGPFAVSGDRPLAYDGMTGCHDWDSEIVPAHPRRLVLPLLADEPLATMIEDLMIASLDARGAVRASGASWHTAAGLR